MAESTVSFKENIELKEKVNRNLLYISIFSSVMLFAGLTSGYIVRQADGGWLKFNMPIMFWVSTGVILISSITANWALVAARKNNFEQVKLALGITLALGLTFCFTQILGWGDLRAGGIFFAGKQANPSGSYFYILSGVHLAHIISGLLYMSFIFYRSLSNNYHSGNLAGVRHAGIFWHFLDGVWVYLFIFMLFMQ
ncbi:MAG: cytochrome c oxidase subunit 3 [Bacteroidia bacterium]